MFYSRCNAHRREKKKRLEEKKSVEISTIYMKRRWFGKMQSIFFFYFYLSHNVVGLFPLPISIIYAMKELWKQWFYLFDVLCEDVEQKSDRVHWIEDEKQWITFAIGCINWYQRCFIEMVQLIA